MTENERRIERFKMITEDLEQAREKIKNDDGLPVLKQQLGQNIKFLEDEIKYLERNNDDSESTRS